ncbi:MAG: spore coat protein [Negativicutes bacterium]|nr:spore coat protein [Negativicutes bacterium]
MANIKYSQSKGNRLSDRDMLLDLLATEKYMSHFYDHAVMESSTDLVRNTFQTLQQRTQDSAYKIYQTMLQNGWYSTDKQTKAGGRKVSRNDGKGSMPLNPGFNGTFRGKTGIKSYRPRYIEHYNTPQ